MRGDIRFHTDVIGDQVLLRSDGYPAYNFAVVVDDGLMGVTQVVRGEDHISNTPRQLLIYEALDLAPPKFGHVAMVLGPDHTRLSKRHGATSVDEFREKGYLPEALAQLPGAAQLVARRRAGARAAWRHGEAVFAERRRSQRERLRRGKARLGEPSLLKGCRPAAAGGPGGSILERAGYLGHTLSDEGLSYLAGIVPVFNTSIDRLDQVPQRLRQLFEFSPEAALAQPEIRAEVDAGSARQVVEALAGELDAAPRLVDKQIFRGLADRVKQRTGQKGRALFHPIRIALTGSGDGPELDLLVPAIDRGADLDGAAGFAPIIGSRERAASFVKALAP